jgi:mono/diheme cytochrome c family protein
MSAKGLPLHHLSLGSIAVIAVLLCLPSRGTAAEPESPGKAAYMRYCSSCHGAGGKGDGPLANMLTTKPTDLTQIAKKAGGQFPLKTVDQAIEGTRPIRGHGEVDMPVWGQRLGTASMRGETLLIEEYIHSIQVK